MEKRDVTKNCSWEPIVAFLLEVLYFYSMFVMIRTCVGERVKPRQLERERRTRMYSWEFGYLLSHTVITTENGGCKQKFIITCDWQAWPVCLKYNSEAKKNFKKMKLMRHYQTKVKRNINIYSHLEACRLSQLIHKTAGCE